METLLMITGGRGGGGGSNGGSGNGAGNGVDSQLSLDDIVLLHKKDKLRSINLSTYLLSGLMNQIQGLEHELSTIVKIQQIKSYSDQTQDTPQGNLISLYENIYEMKTKIDRAKTAISIILQDKTKLEFAKSRILPSTTDVMTEIITLECSFDEFLEEMKHETLDYVKLSQLMKTLHEIFVKLEEYVLIDKVEEIRNQFESLKGVLKRKLLKSFREIGQIMDGVSTTGPGLVPHYSDSIIISLKDAHLIFETFGTESIEDLMGEMVQSQLLSYDKLGREGGPLFHLDKDSLERRWSGLRRLLYAADQRMNEIFPTTWMFSHRLYLEFCDRTICHLKSLLDEDLARYKSVCTACVLARVAERGDNHLVNSNDTMKVTNTTDALSTPTGLQETQEYVSRIVIALKSVITLEEEMSARYEEDICSLTALSQIEEDILGKLTQGSIISSLFDDYMGPYVQLERKNLDDIIRELISQDDLSNSTVTTAINTYKEQKSKDIKLGSNSSSNHSNKILMEQLSTTARQIYDSGGRLFETIRQSMKRCLALTNSKPLYLLSQEYCGCIEIYSNELKRRCPIINYPPTNKSLNVVGGNKAPPYRMPLEDEISICRVINTAEYCSEVIPKLESQIKSKIKLIYENNINFQQQTEIFTDVIATSIQMLVKGVLSLTDGAIRVMKKISWSSLSAVGDESSYIAIVKTTLGDCIPRLRNALSSIWFKNFCTKYAMEFLDQYLTAIMTQKKITPIGAEQLLLDTNALKSIILSIHHIGISSKDQEKRNEMVIPTTYTTIIGARFHHISVVLKLVCVPEDQFEEMFGILWPDGSVAEMQAVYELKHNPSMISSTANAVVGVSEGTKNAFGATTRAFEASTRAIGGSMSKTLAAVKVATQLKKKRQSTINEIDGST